MSGAFIVKRTGVGVPVYVRAVTFNPPPSGEWMIVFDRDLQKACKFTSDAMRAFFLAMPDFHLIEQAPPVPEPDAIDAAIEAYINGPRSKETGIACARAFADAILAEADRRAKKRDVEATGHDDNSWACETALESLGGMP